MTDQDNLRDRIARALDTDAGLTDPGDEQCLTLSSLRTAQAIIDEFGLTVELRAERVMTSPDPLEFDYTQRVVGKWEKQ